MHHTVVKKGNNYESWQNLLLFLYTFLPLSVGLTQLQRSAHVVLSNSY